MGLETLLIVAGLVMDSACATGTACESTGQVMWHIGAIIMAVEFLVVLVFACLAGRR